MSKLDAAERKAIPAKEFAGPGRSYPVEDKGHAKAAKSMATKEMHKGKLKKSVRDHIVAAADKVLDD